MTNTHPRENGSKGEWAFTLIVGLFFCFLTWLTAPYANHILRLGSLADHHLPAVVILAILTVVFVLNPLVRAVRRDGEFRMGQRALIIGMVGVAASVSTSGLMDRLPFGLAGQAVHVSNWLETAEKYEEARLPAVLFPTTMAYQADIDPAEDLIMSLSGEEAMPWEAWAGPAASWGSLFVLFWVMIIGMSALAYPQWRQSERISFPLVQIERTLLKPPDSGGMPAIYRTKGFWMAAGIVFLIVGLMGFQRLFPQRIPVIPLHWSLWSMFREEPLSFLPNYLKNFYVQFSVIAVAFLMPARMSFSIWFFMLTYGAYVVFLSVYSPPYQPGLPDEHHAGAMAALSLVVLWLGRRRWSQALASLFSHSNAPDGQMRSFRRRLLPMAGILIAAALLGTLWPGAGAALIIILLFLLWLRGSEGDSEVRHQRAAMMLFLAGAVGMTGWLRWAGVELHWSLLLTFIVLLYAIAAARVVAETGLLLFGLSGRYFGIFLSFFPVTAVSHGAAWFAGAFAALVGDTTRASTAAAATQAFVLNEEQPARQRTRQMPLYLTVLVLGFFAAGASLLYIGYHHTYSLDRSASQPILNTESFSLSEQLLIQKGQNEWDMPIYNRPFHVASGAVVCGGLYWLSLTFPSWPLHPVGLLLANSAFANKLWASVLIGWMCRIMLVYFGGSRLYSRATNIFIGFFVGEFAAFLFWVVINALVFALGMEISPPGILP